MLVTIAGRALEFSGDQNDGYFRDLQVHAQGFEDLAELATGLPDDAAIFDIGSNIGLSVATLAVIKPGARIYAFEPSPANVAFLRRNTAPFPNVTIVEAAASDAPGTVSFHMAGYGAGSHVVGASHITLGIPTIDVPAIRIDDFAAGHGLHPALVKIDVEGHEPEALAGMRAVLAADRPIVHMEFNTWTLNAFAGHSPAAFARALWRAYDIEIGGSHRPDVLSFLHDHFVKDRCIADLVMRPKAGMTMPELDEMSFSPAALAAIRAAALEPA